MAFSNTGLGQSKRVTHIFFRTIGENIEIFYDLPPNRDTLEIKIYFRKKSAPATRYYIQPASGSIGIGRFSGAKQKVTWHYKKAPSYLFTGSGFYYEVIAKKIHRVTKRKSKSPS
jgi:hypothetical protein